MTEQPEGQPKKLLVTPAPGDACPCGSARWFSLCCEPHLPGFDNTRALRKALKARDLDAAMIAARADITQYVIWHRTNTEPLVRMGHPVGAEMLDIDVKALASAVDELVHVHWLSDQTGELMRVLDRLRTAIQSPAWNRKMTFFQVKTEEVPNGNQEAARREFAKLMPFTETEDDVEVLQTCISLYGSTLSFSKMIGVCDHILRLSNELSVRMQYTSVKAARFLLVDDIQQAGLLFDQVATMARDERDAGELNPYEEWLFAVTLSHLGLLKRQPELLDEAIILMNSQLASPDWKPAGLERLNKLIGDCHRYARRWAESEAAYRTALAALETPAARVFLAETVLYQGRPIDAAAIIDIIQSEALEREEYEDYVFVFAAIAVESGDRNCMQQAVRKLEGFESTAPYFERRRLLLLLRVKQAVELGRTPKNLRSIRRLVAATARSINRYAILEPNWNGLGVNINKALDDLADRLDPPAVTK